MNKKVYFIVLITIFAFLCCYYLLGDDERDEIIFKNEYEKLNDVSWEKNGYSGKYLKITIPEDNLIEYATDDNIVSLFNTGTQIMYLGNPECNWCRQMIPVLIEAAKEYKLKNIYYYDLFRIRNAYEDGSNAKLVNIYEKMSEYLTPFVLSVFPDTSRVAGKLRITAPTLVVISNGKVVDVRFDVKDVHDDYNTNLLDFEKENLKSIYSKMFSKMEFVCNGGC